MNYIQKYCIQCLSKSFCIQGLIENLIICKLLALLSSLYNGRKTIFVCWNHIVYYHFVTDQVVKSHWQNNDKMQNEVEYLFRITQFIAKPLQFNIKT